MFKDRYIPSSQTIWQGRPDAPAASCFFQIVKLLDLQQDIAPQTKPALALLGFNCDEGIRRNMGREGAAEGAHAIRNIVAKLPIHRHDVICYDAGDITCNDRNLEAAQTALGEAVYKLMQKNITPIVLGGGHELAWGHYQGIAKQFPSGNLGIINFDAHFDMRPLLADHQGSSGTPFLQIANAHEQTHRRFSYHCIGIQQAGNLENLFHTANHFQTTVITADEVHQKNTEAYQSLIQKVIHDNEMIYASICLDVFAAAYAPGVSAPQALGLSPWQIIPAIRTLAASKKMIGYDIAELSPKYDIDARTTQLAANLIYEIIHHHQR